MCNCPICTQDNLPSTESTGQIVESATEASRFPGTWAEWKERIRRKRITRCVGPDFDANAPPLPFPREFANDIAGIYDRLEKP